MIMWPWKWKNLDLRLNYTKNEFSAWTNMVLIQVLCKQKHYFMSCAVDNYFPEQGSLLKLYICPSKYTIFDVDHLRWLISPEHLFCIQPKNFIHNDCDVSKIVEEPSTKL